MTHEGVFLVWSSLGMITWWEVWWWFWPMRKSLVMCDPLGKFLLLLNGSVGNLCWFHPRGGFINYLGSIFLHNSRWGYLGALDLCGSPSLILYFTGDSVDDLNSLGSFLGDLWSTKGCFDALNPLGDTLRVVVSFTRPRVFLSFLMHSWIFFCTSYLLGTCWGFFFFFW